MSIFYIHQALKSDVQAVRQLRLEALRAHPEAFSSAYEVERERSLAEWEAQIERADGRTGILFLAYVDQAPAGIAATFRGHSPKTQHSATLNGLYVCPAHRRQGIGTQLVQASIEWARARGVTVLKLAVSNGNVDAIRFYARHGFRVYGLEPRAIRVGDRDYDDLWMALEL
jgi:GNAT superfamily N-acetyltransferase